VSHLRAPDDETSDEGARSVLRDLPRFPATDLHSVLAAALSVARPAPIPKLPLLPRGAAKHFGGIGGRQSGAATWTIFALTPSAVSLAFAAAIPALRRILTVTVPS
jgi:hypothetical protein